MFQIYMYSETCQEATAMADRPPMRDNFCSNMALHFYIFVPLMIDHLSYKTTFYGPMGWSFVTVFTVLEFYENIDADYKFVHNILFPKRSVN